MPKKLTTLQTYPWKKIMPCELNNGLCHRCSKNYDQVFTITSNECFTSLWGNFGSLFAEFFF